MATHYLNSAGGLEGHGGGKGQANFEMRVLANKKKIISSALLLK